MKKALLSAVSLLFLVGGSFLVLSGCGKSGSDSGPHMSGPHMKSSQGKHIDPVCGMHVSSNTRWKSVHGGKTYYFCMQADKKSFDKHPGKYLKKK